MKKIIVVSHSWRAAGVAMSVFAALAESNGIVKQSKSYNRIVELKDDTIVRFIGESQLFEVSKGNHDALVLSEEEFSSSYSRKLSHGELEVV